MSAVRTKERWCSQLLPVRDLSEARTHLAKNQPRFGSTQPDAEGVDTIVAELLASTAGRDVRASH